MSLKENIKPYLTVDGYVSPGVVPSWSARSCDNHPMYTAEYYIMLSRNGELTQDDLLKFTSLITNCVGEDEELHRFPADTSPDEVDDHYGVLAALAEFNMEPMFKLPIRLWRQPQLLYAHLLARGVPSFVMFPLNVYNALVLATACLFTDPQNTDSRRLTWLLWQATKRQSILASLAGTLWYNRQKKVYNTDSVMKKVASIYYESGHPFQTYWVD